MTDEHDEAKAALIGAVWATLAACCERQCQIVLEPEGALGFVMRHESEPRSEYRVRRLALETADLEWQRFQQWALGLHAVSFAREAQ